ncbi:MAG: PAS domain-containing sensor histidine kinase [Litorimonas sp.]
MPVTLNSILDTHPDVICRYGTDHVFTYVNAAAARFFRISKDRLIGSSMIERVPEEQRDGVMERLERLSIDEPAGTSIHEVRRQESVGGEGLWILWTNIALFDPTVGDGETVVGYQSIGRDITTETLMQREVRAQAAAVESMREELRTVLDHVPSRIWYKDDRNTILRLNKAAADSMGMSVEAVEGRNTYDLFGDAAKAYHDDDLAVLRTGDPQRGKVEPFTPNEGETGWVSTDKIPLGDPDAGEPRLLVVSSDITAMKEQEAMLRTINKNLEDFASMTSHDLQAPLRKIGISAELLRLEHGDALPDGADGYLDDMEDGVRHMRAMIRSFLRYMRQSPSSIELETVELGPLLADVAAREADTLAEIGGRLALPDADIRVAGDAPLLGQVFANLLQNAIKYRAPDRPLDVAVTARRDHQFWIVDVVDNGIGVDPTYGDKIFDLFARSKPARAEAGEPQSGSGIGLALSRRIATLHGGSIDLVDTEGRDGSHFRVRLYRRRA